MTAEEGITLSVAIVGALTGIAGLGLALWALRRQIDDDNVRLRVVATWAMHAGPRPRESFLAVSVTNLSKFPVTLDEVGLLIDGGLRAISPDAVTNTGGQLPVRMESRTSVSILFPPEFMRNPEFRTARCAYALTACCVRVESPAGIIPQMIETAQDAGE